MPSLKFIILNALLLLGSWAAVCRFLGFRGGLDRVLGAFVVGASLVVLSFQAVGAFGGINYRDILLVHGAVFVLFWLVSSIKPAGGPAPAVAGCETGPEPSSGFGIALLLLCFCGVFFANAAFALTSPPAVTDAFLDHLVFPAEWLKAGRITLVQTLSPEQATTYYPGNAELLYLWLMLPLHDDLVAGLLETMCLAVAALACVRAGRRLGLADGAVGGAVLAALAPGFMLLSRMFSVDLFFAACFMTAAAFLLPDREGRVSASETIIAGLAAGLAVGAKYVGLPFAILLLPLLVAGSGGGPRVLRAGLFFAAAAATCAYWYVRNIAVTGSAFYPLGLEVAGIEIMQGAHDRAALFRSYLHIPTSDIAYLGRLFSEHIYGYWLLLGSALVFTVGAWAAAGKSGKALLVLLYCCLALGCIGLQSEAITPGRWPAAIPVVAALIFILLIRTLFPQEAWWRRYVLGLGVLWTIIFWFAVPYNTANNYRFIAPAAFFFGLLMAGVLKQSGFRFGWWLLAGCALAANAKNAGRIAGFLREAFSNFGRSGWHADSLTMMGIAALTVFLACVFAALMLLKKYRLSLISGLLFAMSLAACVSFKAGYMESGRYHWYGWHYLGSGWAAIGRIKEPVTIAYAGNCSPYGLYGNGLKNDVLYVNTDGSDLLFHDYEKALREKNNGKTVIEQVVWLDYVYRSEQDFEKWHEALVKKKVDYLFVSKQFYRGHVEMPVEGRWALGHPGLFRQVFHQDDVWIFRPANRTTAHK